MLQWARLVRVLCVPIRAYTDQYVPVRAYTCLGVPIRTTCMPCTNPSRELLTDLSGSKGVPFDAIRMELGGILLVLWNHWG